MQNIRRATRKHRKLLLTVVIILLLGLVGSFATWNSSGRAGAGTGNAAAGEYTLEQQIAVYQEHIAALQQEQADYSNSTSLANSYMELSYLYASKYESDSNNIPTLPTPELDENGEELPLTAEQEAEQATAQAAREAAQAVADASKEAFTNAAGWAEYYFQQALDNAPEDINDAAIANTKFGQAQARDMQGDLSGALAYAEEAYHLDPENPQYLMARISLEQELGNLENAVALLEQASALYPENARLLSQRAAILGDLDRTEEARELFLRARAMAPEDIQVVDAYSRFLFVAESAEVAIAELTAYRDALPEGSANIATADQAIANLQGWADFFASLNVEPELEEKGTGAEDGAGTEDGVAETE